MLIFNQKTGAITVDVSPYDGYIAEGISLVYCLSFITIITVIQEITGRAYTGVWGSILSGGL
jgi:hypothetical protein